jgi:hypothetical protein
MRQLATEPDNVACKRTCSGGTVDTFSVRHQGSACAWTNDSPRSAIRFRSIFRRDVSNPTADSASAHGAGCLRALDDGARAGGMACSGDRLFSHLLEKHEEKNSARNRAGLSGF